MSFLLPDLSKSFKHAEYRKLKSINMQRFREDIRNFNLCVEPPSGLGTLVDFYNRTLFFFAG